MPLSKSSFGLQPNEEILEISNFFLGIPFGLLLSQYIVPLYQRSYDWDTNEWRILLDDILELYEEEKARSHFMVVLLLCQQVQFQKAFLNLL